MQKQQDEELDANNEPLRWKLIRDLIAFQFKLAMDGLRDVLLSPLSLLAVIGGLIFAGNQPGRYFYNLLRIGHRSDQWISLFSAVVDYSTDSNSTETGNFSSDTIVNEVERLVMDDYRSDGIIAKLKQRLDNLLDTLKR